ncbi:MAG TPA: mobile mystery protein B [Gallionella sp.]|nr:mobile mystery protein B [Gallionella sp.]
MAVTFEYPPGATPLDTDELACLIPGHIVTQGELNEWEQLNIAQGEAWALRQRKDILDDAFVRQLHHRMFGETWSWAGSYRTTDKNTGVEWQQVGVKLRDLLNDVRYQVEHATYTPDEIAARFHHRLVAIHPFPNGNGRHARMMADLLIQKLGQPKFSWGSKRLTEASETRARYIEALRAADNGDIKRLLDFVRN